MRTTENNKTAREGGSSIQERAHTKIKKGAHKSCNTLQHCNATCCNGNTAKTGMVTTAEDDKGLLTIANQCWETLGFMMANDGEHCGVSWLIPPYKMLENVGKSSYICEL